MKFTCCHFAVGLSTFDTFTDILFLDDLVFNSCLLGTMAATDKDAEHSVIVALFAIATVS